MSIAVALGQLVLFVGHLGAAVPGAAAVNGRYWYMAVPMVACGTLAFLAIGLLVGSIAKTSEGGQRPS